MLKHKEDIEYVLKKRIGFDVLLYDDGKYIICVHLVKKRGTDMIPESQQYVSRTAMLLRMFNDIIPYVSLHTLTLRDINK